MSANGMLVVDAGTSALRAVLVRGCETRTLATAPWRIFAPRGAPAFAREIDGAEIRAAFEGMIDAASPAREDIAGIAVTGQREGIVFLDGAGEPLLVSPNVDARAAMEGMAIDAAHGDAVYETTGHLPSLMQAPAKLAWLRANEPEIASRVRRVMPLADWLAALLTGEHAMSRSLASEVGLVDVRTGAVATSLLETLDFDPALLPPVVDDGTVVGTARGDGIAGLSVALCGADTQCALAGMGVAAPESAGIVAGWSTPVQMTTETPLIDGEQRTWTGLHVLPKRWILESNAGDCGRAWEWVCSMLSMSAAEADLAAAASPPGSHDALAVLGPRAMRASAMNVTTGALTMPMPLALAAPSRGDVARAALESIAYAMRANLEQIEGITGAPATSIALGGGLRQSGVFPQIVADVLGRPATLARTVQTSAIGAAAIASPALGLHDTIDRAIDVAAAGATAIEPDLHASAVYDDCYARWQALATQLESGAM